MRAKNSKMIDQVKKNLIIIFKIVDVGPNNFYHSIKNSRKYNKKTIKLSQPVYINKILT